jgi:hypothetical protein
MEFLELGMGICDLGFEVLPVGLRLVSIKGGSFVLIDETRCGCPSADHVLFQSQLKV